jgi:hypothetical protein
MSLVRVKGCLIAHIARGSLTSTTKVTKRFDAQVVQAFLLRAKERRAAGETTEATKDFQQALFLDPSVTELRQLPAVRKNCSTSESSMSVGGHQRTTEDSNTCKAMSIHDFRTRNARELL